MIDAGDDHDVRLRHQLHGALGNLVAHQFEVRGLRSAFDTEQGLTYLGALGGTESCLDDRASLVPEEERGFADRVVQARWAEVRFDGLTIPIAADASRRARRRDQLTRAAPSTTSARSRSINDRA